MTHQPLLNLINWHIDTYRLGPDDVISQVANPSFDAAGWEIWPALLAGSRIDIPPAEVPASAEALVTHLKESGTTVAFVPTPMAHLLAHHDLSGSSLRCLLTGGDRLNSLPGGGPGVPLVNHYGPTENAVVTTAYGPLAPDERRPAIGRPLPNMTIRLLDQWGEPAGPGVPGEICVGGAGLARGYAGRPDLTADRFIPDPFAARPGERLYRTGDLARWRPDGNLEFLGRADRQIKIRGYRIEPGEIEAALAQHGRLAESVVRVATTASGEPVLVAYVVARGTPAPPAAAPSAAALRAFLAARLPEYMIPSVFVPMAELPRQRTGKIDAGRLPGPPSAGSEYLAPRDEVEQAIADVWERMMDVRRPSVDADFFALGGHSMLANQIVAELSHLFSVRLPIRSMFDNRTIADMAHFLEHAVCEGNP